MTMADEQSSIIDDVAFTVRRSIRIEAPVAKVWAAVTEPEYISRWFGRTELDGAGPGASGTITFEQNGSVPIRVEAMDAPVSVTYRWSDGSALAPYGDDEAQDRATVFTFTLDAVDGGTRLTVVESGFERTADPAAGLADHAEGWVAELDKLVALLEGES